MKTAACPEWRSRSTRIVFKVAAAADFEDFGREPGTAIREHPMRQLFFGLILFATAGATAGSAMQGSDAPLDISGITAVAISGDASSVAITTAPEQAHQATVKRHRSGWFAQWNSGWVYDDCSASSRMTIEGSLLRIDVGMRTWFGMSDCSDDINLNVKQNTTVAIDQQALKADLSGDFSALTITAKAGDIALSGHADTVSLRGDALRVGLAFQGAEQNEAVTIDARMLEADLDFSAAPSLAYSVTAKAALVSSARHSTPGAKPSLTVAGDFVHATIR
jgi:hypothetical protein